MTDDDPETGLVTLEGPQLRVLRRLDACLLDKALCDGAAELAFPPLVSLASLVRVDQLRNFPHLGLAVAPLRDDSAAALAAGAQLPGDELGHDTLSNPRYFLPSAACYPVYARLRGQTLDEPQRFTTVQRCFRKERAYEGLMRLLGFTMREIVMVGGRRDVQDFLAAQKVWIARFAAGAGLALTVQVATDPFFEADGGRARMQRLFPVKEEFVFAGSLALSSVNFHRNFFGERWYIRGTDGQPAFTGCVAFGLERWLHALLAVHGEADAACDAIVAGAGAAADAAP